MNHSKDSTKSINTAITTFTVDLLQSSLVKRIIIIAKIKVTSATTVVNRITTITMPAS